MNRTYWPDEEPEQEWVSLSSVLDLCGYCGHAGHDKKRCPNRPLKDMGGL